MKPRMQTVATLSYSPIDRIVASVKSEATELPATTAAQEPFGGTEDVRPELGGPRLPGKSCFSGVTLEAAAKCAVRQKNGANQYQIKVDCVSDTILSVGATGQQKPFPERLIRDNTSI